MGRLTRFEEHRFIGTRDTMLLYDCDEASEMTALDERVAADDLLGRNLLQTFAPDTVAEARNRGFRPT